MGDKSRQIAQHSVWHEVHALEIRAVILPLLFSQQKVRSLIHSLHKCTLIPLLMPDAGNTGKALWLLTYNSTCLQATGGKQTRGAVMGHGHRQKQAQQGGFQRREW
jgi:hypothetical protein